MGLLRTVLALSVVFAHLGIDHLDDGAIAVQMFYIISGILISHVILSGAYTSVRTFYLNRALRLFPAYYVVAGASLAACAVQRDKLIEFAALPFAAQTLLAFSNLFLFGQDWVMFLGLNGPWLVPVVNVFEADPKLYRFLLVPQAWSLGLEMTFYLLAPFMLPRFPVLVAVAIATFALRAWGISNGLGLQDPWSYRFLPFELGWFVVGSLSHQVLLPRAKMICAASPTWKLDLLAVAGLLAAIALYRLLPVPGVYKSQLLLLVCGALVPFAFIFQNRHQWDGFVGEFSYPLYIVHMLVIYVMIFGERRFGLSLGNSGFQLVALMLSMLASAGLLLCVMRPLEGVRSRVKMSREGKG